VTHPRLTRIAVEQAREEIVSSKRRLEDEFGVRVDHFCYPFGDWNERIAAMVAEAGYRSAVSTDVGINTRATNPFALKRIASYFPLRNPRNLWLTFRP
jgi:peptidoglycan/xylan/chitin deacetylase (PgdA/CDA1 family)